MKYLYTIYNKKGDTYLEVDIIPLSLLLEAVLATLTSVSIAWNFHHTYLSKFGFCYTQQTSFRLGMRRADSDPRTAKHSRTA